MQEISSSFFLTKYFITMKHIKQISTVFIGALFMAVAVFYSCSKQEITDQPVTGNGEVTMSEGDINFQNKLVRFRDKVEYIRENPDYKSGEVMDADSALLHIETLFNATYSFADEQYGRTNTKRTTVFIDVTSNDEVDMDNVVSTFDEIINIVTQFYYQCDFEQKGFILLDLEKGDVVGNQVEIYLRAVIGEKGGDWNPFGPDDDWWFAFGKGDCDWNDPGTDAAEEIQEAINTNKPIVSPPPGYRFAYRSYEQITLFGHEYEDESGAKLMFYIEKENGIFTIHDKCLIPDEMNFHFNGEKEVIYTRVPVTLNKPSNWVFMECDLEGKVEPNPNAGDIPSIHHNNKLTYALRYLVAIVIIGPPIEL